YSNSRQRTEKLIGGAASIPSSRPATLSHLVFCSIRANQLPPAIVLPVCHVEQSVILWRVAIGVDERVVVRRAQFMHPAYLFPADALPTFVPPGQDAVPTLE